MSEDLVLNQENLDESQENFQVEFNESSEGFNGQILLNQEKLSQINKSSLSLKKENIFRIPTLSFLKRKNNIFYFVSTKEMHVDIKDTKGSVYLPLITKEEINKQLQKIDSKIRSTISTVHLGAIKIVLKSEFQEGIDSPVKMALIDNRINDRKDCILGAARGNLAYRKFMFSVYPKFEISLNTKNLDQVLSFVHEFERSNLMNKGDKVFSLTYLVAYALTNSVHSIEYKKKEYIELEDVFSDIGKIEEKSFSPIEQPNDSWAINIAKNKPVLGIKPRLSISRNSLEIGEPSTRYISPRERNDRDLLRSMSKRIEDLTNYLQDNS